MIVLSRIAKLNETYFINFDDHCLYDINNSPLLEIKGRELEILEYFCNNPNNYRTTQNINDYLDDGCLSNITVRGYISNLRNLHSVFNTVIVSSKGNGYKYTGDKITTTQKTTIPITNIQTEQYKQNFVAYINGFIKSIIFCECKWGACIYDTILQSTNTCEGLLALLLSHKDKEYKTIINSQFDHLITSSTRAGLKSLSLDEETVVPTAMLLYISNTVDSSLHISDSRTLNNIAKSLWDARSFNGWGLYVRNMDKYCNIGCTYWAIIGLLSCNNINHKELQDFICSFYRYNETFTFGQYIDDVNPKMPSLYSTAMMFIIFFMLDDDSRKIIGNKYNYKKALNYIINNFDNPYCLVEQEGLHGVDTQNKTKVHTVNWNHITIHYSLTALSIGIQQKLINEHMMKNILDRIETLIVENSTLSDGRRYWSDPKMPLENGARGKFIFPTMHFVMGLSKFIDAI